MLKPKKRRRSYLPYALLAASVLVAVAAVTLTPSFRECERGYEEAARSSKPEGPHPETNIGIPERVLLVVECETEFFHKIEGLLTAAATVLIALFTLSLRQSTDRLWEAGENRWDLANDTAERQLRAYLGVRAGDLRHAPGGWIVWVDYVNNGQTPAHDVKGSISVKLLEIDPKRIFPPAEEWYGSWVIIPHAHATPERFVVVSGTEESEMRQGRSLKAVFVWGHIAYRDVFDGITNVTFRYRLRFKLDRTGWYLHTEPDGNTTTYESKRTGRSSEP